MLTLRSDRLVLSLKFVQFPFHRTSPDADRSRSYTDSSLRALSTPRSSRRNSARRWSVCRRRVESLFGPSRTYADVLIRLSILSLLQTFEVERNRKHPSSTPSKSPVENSPFLVITSPTRRSLRHSPPNQQESSVSRSVWIETTRTSYRYVDAQKSTPLFPSPKLPQLPPPRSHPSSECSSGRLGVRPSQSGSRSTLSTSRRIVIMDSKRGKRRRLSDYELSRGMQHAKRFTSESRSTEMLSFSRSR